MDPVSTTLRRPDFAIALEQKSNLDRVATGLEIREESGKIKIDLKGQGIWEKKRKVNEFDRLSERESFATPQIQLMISVSAKMLY